MGWQRCFQELIFVVNKSTLAVKQHLEKLFGDGCSAFLSGVILHGCFGVEQLLVLQAAVMSRPFHVMWIACRPGGI